MRPIDILWYLLGREDAIRRVAANKASIKVGFVLVLTAGIAREYDQTYIPHFGIRFLLPLLTSLLAALVIYGFLRIVLPPRDAEQPSGRFRCFLGLFWMTAPLAWVYAFPAEHLFAPREAAWINIGLLAFVAIARVLVLSRAIAVLTQICFVRVLASVLCISSVIMGIGSIGAALSLVRLMGGLRYSPEEEVLSAATNFAFVASICGFFVAAITAGVLAKVKQESRFEFPCVSDSGVMPWKFVVVLLATWFVVLIPQQYRLARNHHAMVMVHRENYKEFVQFLSKHSPEDFNQVKRLPPDTYEYHGLSHLAGIANALDGSEALWVREMVLNSIDVALQHRDPYVSRVTPAIAPVLRLPGGEDWVKARALKIEERFNREYDRHAPPEMTSLAQRLKALGLKIADPEQTSGARQ